MLICALEVGAAGVRMVLAGHAALPFVLDSDHFPLDVSPERLAATIVNWDEQYGGIALVVCCDADPWPPALTRMLRRVEPPVHWVGGRTMQAALDCWRSVQPPADWLRATLLAAAVFPRESEWQEVSGGEAAYAVLRGQALDAEVELMVAGVDLCPRHLLDDCSLCGKRSDGATQRAAALASEVPF